MKNLLMVDRDVAPKEKQRIRGDDRSVQEKKLRGFEVSKVDHEVSGETVQCSGVHRRRVHRRHALGVDEHFHLGHGA